jgi:hypothetical protein
MRRAPVPCQNIRSQHAASWQGEAVRCARRSRGVCVGCARRSPGCCCQGGAPGAADAGRIRGPEAPKGQRHARKTQKQNTTHSAPIIRFWSRAIWFAGGHFNTRFALVLESRIANMQHDVPVAPTRLVGSARCTATAPDPIYGAGCVFASLSTWCAVDRAMCGHGVGPFLNRKPLGKVSGARAGNPWARFLGAAVAGLAV